jgi:hypothetical protein
MSLRGLARSHSHNFRKYITNKFFTTTTVPLPVSEDNDTLPLTVLLLRIVLQQSAKCAKHTIVT